MSITAGARLTALSGRTGITAGEMLALLAPGANAGARLVARSGLPSATAGVHLLHDRGAAGMGGVGRLSARRRRQDRDDDVLLFLLRSSF